MTVTTLPALDKVPSPCVVSLTRVQVAWFDVRGHDGVTVTDSLIPLFDVRLTDAEIAAVEATLRSGWLTMGPRTRGLRGRRSRHTSGCRHAVAVSSGTAALHLAFLAAGSRSRATR